MRNRAATRLTVKKNETPKIRQSWSKYNLFNLTRLRGDPYRPLNFFKTKWKSKSLSRSYHGEQVREKQWVRMFDRRIRSVIPMNARYLASNDGSRESAGRGSGLVSDRNERNSSRWDRTKKKKEVPYMQMTYAPMERRLDTAIFRALFASSARQARQFVVHGAVKVNGKQMRYPGYLLNPGDMFQVLPERVMYATGAPKVNERAKSEDKQNADEEATEEIGKEEQQPAAEPEEAEAQAEEQDPREVLKALKSQARALLASSKQDLGAKRKQDLRAFSKSIQRLLSKSKSASIETDSAEAQLAEIQQQLQVRRENKAAGEPSSSPSAVQVASASVEGAAETQTETKAEQQLHMDDEEYNELLTALRSMQENPIDDSKPYATPWTPRDYMSVFAFVPRFLEVNHKICAAVYLRHPVARPGLAEVPTPFSEYINSSAFTWYLRRR